MVWRTIFNLAVLAMTTRMVQSVPSISRAVAKSFAGSNEYFLHALPEAEQKEYVKTLAGWGVKVLRLWG